MMREAICCVLQPVLYTCVYLYNALKGNTLCTCFVKIFYMTFGNFLIQRLDSRMLVYVGGNVCVYKFKLMLKLLKI